MKQLKIYCIRPKRAQIPSFPEPRNRHHNQHYLTEVLLNIIMSNKMPQERELNKSNSQPLNYDDSSDENFDNSVSFLDEPETAPCYSCKKLLPKSSEEVCCNFCEHWYCVKCSHLKKKWYIKPSKAPLTV